MKILTSDGRESAFQTRVALFFFSKVRVTRDLPGTQNSFLTKVQAAGNIIFVLDDLGLEFGSEFR